MKQCGSQADDMHGYMRQKRKKERMQETTLGEMIILTTEEDNNLSYEMLQN